MYGIGLLKGMGVTLKNLASPGRMFSVQYPDRRVGLFGLAKANDTNVLSLAKERPGDALKALVGLATVSARLTQHPVFAGRSLRGTSSDAPDARAVLSTVPLGSSASLPTPPASTSRTVASTISRCLTSILGDACFAGCVFKLARTTLFTWEAVLRKGSTSVTNWYSMSNS